MADDTPKRGRPKSDEPSTAILTWMPASHHDRLIEMAKQREISVSGLVRQILVIQLQNEKP
jgi:hypothetical protein